METRKERFDRLQLAFNLVAHHDTELSFSGLIEPNRDTFHGFKLVYSTNHLEGDFANTSLKAIEDECPTLKKYFYGSGLLFFSDELYDRTWKEGHVKLPIDGELAFAVQDVPSEALAFSNKAEAGCKRSQKLELFPSQFFRCCCLFKKRKCCRNGRGDPRGDCC
ncbi:hypothetical protein H5202_01985 [Shewanella sp. SG41-4]|uniref:hypothetical protein n=1 Tax=Shewanella sp. SG41-4 TaxID=2760976 RepID=UPI001602B1E0|nr:hypothetical protein [Shewanella sp. SG41-4]MBB1437455.1 hypothetical protein [Shewanella sp. SG41-4]